MTPVACVVPRGGDHCDFCQTSPVFTVYACSNFTVNGMNVFESPLTVGSWATCRKCSELVEQKKWSDLSERAYRMFAKSHGITRHVLLGARRAKLEPSGDTVKTELVFCENEPPMDLATASPDLNVKKSKTV